MLKLYNYWRSSASYRVRIALGLKGIAYEYIAVNIIAGGGAQYGDGYRALNPQSRVPLLVDGDFRVAQSLAILQYLEQQQPQPSLLPKDSQECIRMWAFCHSIASDIQPLQNIGPLGYLTREFGISEEQKNTWVRHWIERGLVALEQERAGSASEFVFGDVPSLADCLLAPQMYNAERFGCDLKKFPQLHAIARRCLQLPAFIQAHPDQQPDAPRPA